jgi:hypothetical protein
MHTYLPGSETVGHRIRVLLVSTCRKHIRPPLATTHFLVLAAFFSLATLLLTVDSTGFRKSDLVEVEHLSCMTDAHPTCTTPLLGGLHRAIVMQILLNEWPKLRY